MHIVAVLFCFPLFDRGLVMVTHMHAKIIEIVHKLPLETYLTKKIM